MSRAPRSGAALLAALLLALSTLPFALPTVVRADDPAAVAPPARLQPARQPAHAAIASAHPLATQAGLDVLARGGNAYDAAVAVSAVLAVVEPASSGVGGGGFYLLHFPSGRNVMVDARETAPAAATRDMYLDAQGNARDQASRSGPLAAAIPGEPAAWAWLAQKYGRLPLKDSLASAIRIAREGFPLYPRLQNAIRVKQADIARSRETARVFLAPGGAVPESGALIRQPELAKTLTLIAEGGADAFYRGRFAERLAQAVRRDGGIWTAQDLANYRVIEREPIVARYRNATIVSGSPPASGGIVLVDALNILSGYELDKVDAVTRKHLVVEAMRRSYRDRAEYLGDPDFVQIPTALLTSPMYAAGQRTSLRMDRATPSAVLRPVAGAPESASTTHFSVLDREGNRVAATVSVNLFFGSLYVAPGTGFVLNDTMDDFAARPNSANAFGLVGADANAIAPGKRPLSSMTPTFVETDAGLAILGSPGGSFITTMVLQGTLAWLDGKSASEIVGAPRIHHQYQPDAIVYEPGALTPDEQKALTALGHTLREGRSWGNMQVVTWDYASGKVDAASDPRGFGAGLVY